MKFLEESAMWGGLHAGIASPGGPARTMASAPLQRRHTDRREGNRGGPLAATLSKTGALTAPVGRGSTNRPGCARMDRLTIGPQVANLPHNDAQVCVLHAAGNVPCHRGKS
jgi:hypothetical protein